MLFTNMAYAAGHGSTTLFSFGNFGPLGPFVISSELATMWALMLIITVVCYLGTRNMKDEPKGLQNLLEMAVEMLGDFMESILGKKRAKMLLPFLMTFFILILFSNYSGLLPMAGQAWVEHGTVLYKPPTSNVNVTGALALIAICSMFYYGMKTHGVGGYLKEYFLTPMAPVNILEMFTKPLSLALRLYGNIYGEEMVVAVLMGLLPFILPLPMQVLSLLFGAVQAFVFTLLVAIYLDEATEVHEAHETH